MLLDTQITCSNLTTTSIPDLFDFYVYEEPCRVSIKISVCMKQLYNWWMNFH
jgi:hypothetical protein